MRAGFQWLDATKAQAAMAEASLPPRVCRHHHRSAVGPSADNFQETVRGPPTIACANLHFPTKYLRPASVATVIPTNTTMKTRGKAEAYSVL
ncbi:hypothetical protein J4E81_005521 [Alternaria sp. BMP 2799]|nr:hypothetical protein J4E81_005521 [Alternaria sp. BMP 2799]